MNGQLLQDRASTHRSSKEDIGQLLEIVVDLQQEIIIRIILFINKDLGAVAISSKTNVRPLSSINQHSYLSWFDRSAAVLEEA